MKCMKNAVNPALFYVLNTAEKGFFYSVNVELRGAPLLARPA